MAITYNRSKEFVSSVGRMTRANLKKVSHEEIIKRIKEGDKHIADRDRATKKIAEAQTTRMEKIIEKAADKVMNYIISLADKYKSKGLIG